MRNNSLRSCSCEGKNACWDGTPAGLIVGCSVLGCVPHTLRDAHVYLHTQMVQWLSQLIIRDG